MPIQPESFVTIGRSMTAGMDSVDLLKNELAAEVIRSFGELRLRVVGSSMLPAIWPDDVLLVRHCDIADAALGDIVLFLRQRRLYAHRVVRRSDACVVTRGDGNGEFDSPLSADELLGRVSTIWRRGNVLRVGSKLTYPQRVTALLVRRSATAGRVLTRLHALRSGAGA